MAAGGEARGSSSRATRSFEVIDESLQGDGVDFETDVKPLLGDRAAIAALNVPNVSGITSTDAAGAAGAAENALSDTGVGVVDMADGKDAAVTGPGGQEERAEGRARRRDLLQGQGRRHPDRRQRRGTSSSPTPSRPLSPRSTRTRPAATRPWPARASSPTRWASSRTTSSPRATSTSGAVRAPGDRRRPAARAARPARGLPGRGRGGVGRRRARRRAREGRRAPASATCPPAASSRPPSRPTSRPTRSPTSASATWPVSSPRCSGQVQGSLGARSRCSSSTPSPRSSRCSWGSRSTTSRRSARVEHALVVTDGAAQPGRGPGPPGGRRRARQDDARHRARRSARAGQDASARRPRSRRGARFRWRTASRLAAPALAPGRRVYGVDGDLAVIGTQRRTR